MHTILRGDRKIGGKPSAASAILGVLVISALFLAGAGEAAGSPPAGGLSGSPPAGMAAGSLPAGLAGQQDLRLNRAFFKGFLYDAGSVVAAPISWGGSDWLKFALITGAAIAAAGEEDHVQHWVQAERNDDTHFAADLAEPMGNGRYVLPALGALYLCGRFSGRNRMRRTALLSFESVIVSCGITGAVKYLSHKHRPLETSTEDIPWEGPSISSTHLSFPSGHSTCAFAVGTVVASEYRDSRLIPPLAYAAAAICATSRMHDNAHWLSDVIIGSAIGYFTARTIVGRHGGARPGFNLAPSIREDGPALSLAYRF